VTPKTSNIVIKNNIISNSCGPAVFGSTSSNLVAVTVSNNLGFHNGYACDWSTCSTQYSCAYGSYFVCSVGTNLPNADPRFVNTAGTWGSTSKDYHLQAGSPARGVADPAYTPLTDASGAARLLYYSNVTGSSAPALGAFGS